MNFKLLAIRPLKGCDLDILKGLKTNCIYRFCNEYDYLFGSTSTTAGDKANENSIIVFQENYFADTNNQDDKFLKLEYKKISRINFDEKIPQDLYGDNISISAIVGKNGSGKSTLLEILYIYLYNISVEYYSNPDADFIKNFEKLNAEIIVMINNDIYIFKMQCFEDSEAKINATKIEISVSKFDGAEITSLNVSKELVSKFYTNVVNYSIYGLNSNVSGPWLDNLYYKNDRYQVPIVINPFRQQGIIDINREYNLAQQRLVLNHYVIENRKLLQNVTLQNVNYTIDILKNQYLKVKQLENNQGNVSEGLIINRLLEFIEINLGVHAQSSDSLSHFIDPLFIVFEINNSVSKKRLLNFFTKNIENQKFRQTDNNFKINNNDSLNVEHYEYLCLLYVFKKMRKISETYEEFKIYSPLFKNNWTGGFLGENTLKLYNEIYQGLNIESVHSLKESLDQQNKFSEKIYKNYFKKLSILILDEKDSELIHTTVYKVVNDRINGTDNNQDLSELLTSIYSKLDEELDPFRDRIFNSLLVKLKNNKDHITFKLKQALNYFADNKFEKIVSAEYNSKLDKHILELKENFIDENDDIEKIPLALFEPIITVKKNNDAPYEFNRLSSGEQQMIHSLLNVVYHTYNIGSKNNSYKNINLIFDEVELYFHPEYQRSFISNLLQNLNFFSNKSLNFNIIFSTHSPFILSDVPSQNILKLEDGIPEKNKDAINSFGANIHDLLSDEFFMENGTIGKFAEETIKELIRFYHLVIIAHLDNNQQSLKKLKKEYFKRSSKFNFIAKNVGEIVYQSLLKNHLQIIESKLNVIQ